MKPQKRLQFITITEYLLKCIMIDHGFIDSYIRNTLKSRAYSSTSISLVTYNVSSSDILKTIYVDTVDW